MPDIGRLILKTNRMRDRMQVTPCNRHRMFPWHHAFNYVGLSGCFGHHKPLILRLNQLRSLKMHLNVEMHL